MLKTIKGVFLGLWVLSSSLAWGGAAKVPCQDFLAQGNTATVIRLSDGDTIGLKNSLGTISVRMLSIDTPELHFKGQAQGTWGQSSADALAKLLKVGDVVEVEVEAEVCDRYGRMLAHIWKGKTNINLEMVKNADAVMYCIFPNEKYCRDYGAATEAAMKAKAGVFSDPKLELPYLFRRRLDKRPADKWVGSLKDLKVYAPTEEAKVEVWDRIYFLDEPSIVPPYSQVSP
ncbi:MAG: thermonuclease family protein [Bdellovibrionales bacterium]|nr:thermonuclease family protein [Bdellovibrionales bacterium]